MEAEEHGLESHDVKVFDTVNYTVKMSDRTPAYRGPVLKFNAQRLAALREGDMTEEALAT